MDSSRPLKWHWLLSFYAMWLFILVVSVHDIYWIIFNRLTIHQDERNPIGRWFIELNDGKVWLFVAIKCLGTILSASILLLLYWRCPRVGWAVCCGVAVVQLWVLFWLF